MIAGRFGQGFRHLFSLFSNKIKHNNIIFWQPITEKCKDEYNICMLLVPILSSDLMIVDKKKTQFAIIAIKKKKPNLLYGNQYIISFFSKLWH